MGTARVFRSGNSQDVSFPRSCRLCPGWKLPPKLFRRVRGLKVQNWAV